MSMGPIARMFVNTQLAVIGTTLTNYPESVSDEAAAAILRVALKHWPHRNAESRAQLARMVESLSCTCGVAQRSADPAEKLVHNASCEFERAE